MGIQALLGRRAPLRLGRQLVAPTPYKLSNTVQRDLPIDDETVIHRESYFGQGTMDLYEQLYFTASLRNDGFSNFGRLSRRAFVQKMVALGRLAAGAAHEINNPLTAVMGYADLLHDDATLSSEEARSATKIKEEVRRAQSAILSFRRVAASAMANSDLNSPAEPFK